MSRHRKIKAADLKPSLAGKTRAYHYGTQFTGPEAALVERWDSLGTTPHPDTYRQLVADTVVFFRDAVERRDAGTFERLAKMVQCLPDQFGPIPVIERPDGQAGFPFKPWKRNRAGLLVAEIKHPRRPYNAHTPGDPVGKCLSRFALRHPEKTAATIAELRAVVQKSRVLADDKTLRKKWREIGRGVVSPRGRAGKSNIIQRPDR